MSEGSLIERADAVIADFFASWNIYTTVLVGIALLFLIYPLLTSRDPDIHPFLLARQSQAAPVRQPEESAVLRAVDIPHGYPLRSGLGIKDPGAPRWSAGRNGDLRDIWRQAVRGPVKEDGTSEEVKGKVVTVLGRERVIEHSLEELTRDIIAIGEDVRGKGGKSVAVCLSNSTELLCSIFASAFYNFSVTLLPYGLPPDQVTTILTQAKADFLIAEAGTLDLDAVFSATHSIRQFIWVVKEGSKHMDWADTSHGATGGVTVGTWHDIVAKAKSSTSTELPASEKDSKVCPIVISSLDGDGNYEMVEFTSGNIISAVAASNATLARGHKMTSSDILLPTTPLADAYTLCWTLTAVFSHATVALNSVVGSNIDLASATAGISPTIITASPATLSTYIERTTQSAASLPTQLSHTLARRKFAAGLMPSKRPSVALSSLAHLRLLLIPQLASATSEDKLTSSTLAQLRLLLGARIGYALTHPHVAGPVAQTNILDYRDKGRVVCVGPPVGSVEVLLSGSEDEVGSQQPKGKIVVKGPAVSVGGVGSSSDNSTAGKITLQTIAVLDDDYTLVLL